MKPSNNGSSFVPPAEKVAHKLTKQRSCSCPSTGIIPVNQLTKTFLVVNRPMVTNQILNQPIKYVSRCESTNQMPSRCASTNGNPSGFNSTNHTVSDSLWHQVMSYCSSAMINEEKIFVGSIFSDIDNILANHANINIGEMDFHPQNDNIK